VVDLWKFVPPSHVETTPQALPVGFR